MDDLFMLSHFETRSISAENFTGEKGKAGMATEGTGANAARELGIGWKVSPSIRIPAGETITLADVSGEGMITHIWMTDTCKKNRRMILRMYWDGSDTPSVEVPSCDFFAATDYQNAPLINSLMVCVNPKRAFNCYWQMPFKKGFKITMENLFNEEVTLYYQIDYQLGALPRGSAYFHAQFNRTNPLPYKEVYTILDGVKGKGHYVGTYMYWGVNNNGWWGEGEIKFYMDGDKDFPTICGTGTEDYFCGAWNFDIGGKYTPFSTAYSGLWISPTDEAYKSNRRFSLYRWHIKDPIRFNSDLRVTIQALGWRTEGRYLPLQDDISSVAYFYLDRVYDVSGTMPDKDGLELL
ncbi:MAG: DUF2961 domain-containing protein [Clostridia bacterium]|nr:DUF2961 domain-containing protein [Clostridia bacterium]